MNVFRLDAAIPGNELMFFNFYRSESDANLERVVLESLGLVTRVFEVNGDFLPKEVK